MNELLAGVPTGAPGRPHVGRTRRCPRCGGEYLRPVETTGGIHLLCTGCHRCWQFEDGYLVEVNTLACPGCADRTLCRAW